MPVCKYNSIQLLCYLYTFYQVLAEDSTTMALYRAWELGGEVKWSLSIMQGTQQRKTKVVMSLTHSSPHILKLIMWT